VPLLFHCQCSLVEKTKSAICGRKLSTTIIICNLVVLLCIHTSLVVCKSEGTTHLLTPRFVAYRPRDSKPRRGRLTRNHQGLVLTSLDDHLEALFLLLLSPLLDIKTVTASTEQFYSPWRRRQSSPHGTISGLHTVRFDVRTLVHKVYSTLRSMTERSAICAFWLVNSASTRQSGLGPHTRQPTTSEDMIIPPFPLIGHATAGSVSSLLFHL